MKHGLLTAGVLLAGLALFAGTLTVAGAALRQPVKETVLTVTKEEETVSFPYPIEGTSLTVEKLAVYEGPALEEGSDEPLVDVLALMLNNTGQQEVLFAQILLKTGDTTHRFTGTHIPAESKVLLIEKDHAPWAAYPYTACSGSAVTAENNGLFADEVEVTEIGMGELMLTNLTRRKLKDVRIYHKNFLRVYIGGITYCTEAGSLEAGESIKIFPDHYAAGYSKIVRIEEE